MYFARDNLSLSELTVMAFMNSRDYTDIPRYLKYPIPEHKLIVQVLNRAVRDTRLTPKMQGYSKYREEAIDWFLDDSREPFSFNWICEFLSIQPDKFLTALDLQEGPSPE